MQPSRIITHVFITPIWQQLVFKSIGIALLITLSLLFYTREREKRERKRGRGERCIHDTERERDVFITDTVMLNGSKYLNSYRMWWSFGEWREITSATSGWRMPSPRRRISIISGRSWRGVSNSCSTLTSHWPSKPYCLISTMSILWWVLICYLLNSLLEGKQLNIWFFWFYANIINHTAAG